MIKPESIEDMETFLALSYLLEIESADRYHELADNMQVHHDPEIAMLFRRLAGYGEAHATEIMQHAEGMVLPTIASWEFEWENPEGPETTPYELVSYEISPEKVFQLARHNEIRGRDFYAHIAQKSPNPSIRQLAAEFSEEETEHVALLNGWMSEMAQQLPETRDDMDPPNMPE